MVASGEECVSHLNKYKGRQVVVDVLRERTSFVDEVSKFYGISQGYAPSIFGNDKKIMVISNSPNSRMSNEEPSELIEILNPFSESGLDSEKLGFAPVRDDAWRMLSKGRTNLGRLGGAVALGLSVGSGGVAIANASTGNYSEAVGLALISVAGIGCLLGLGFFDWKKNKSNGEVKEYLKLHSAAEEADHLMWWSYRHFHPVEKTSVA